MRQKGSKPFPALSRSGKIGKYHPWRVEAAKRFPMSVEQSPSSQNQVTEDPVTLQVDGSVANLMLNRPQKRNALSFAMLEKLHQALESIESNPDVRVVVLSAVGKVFCSGHDLKEMTHQDESEYRKLFQLCSDVMQKIRKIPQPVIAKVHSLATAAGCQLVAACDLALATPESGFATPGVKIGLFCTTPMVPLVRSVPAKAAMEMLLTGTPISANRAKEIGLVNDVVDSGQIDERIATICNAIIESSPNVVALGKRAFYDQLPLAENHAYEQACEIMTGNAVMADAREGINAFLEKRKPNWPAAN